MNHHTGVSVGKNIVFEAEPARTISKKTDFSDYSKML